MALNEVVSAGFNGTKRTGQLAQIYTVLETGAQQGQLPFDQHLAELVAAGRAEGLAMALHAILWEISECDRFAVGTPTLDAAKGWLEVNIKYGAERVLKGLAAYPSGY